MRKIEILIREVELDKDDMTDTGHKNFTTMTIVEENNLDIVLPQILDSNWTKLKEYYLQKRAGVPFTPIKWDAFLVRKI